MQTNELPVKIKTDIDTSIAAEGTFMLVTDHNSADAVGTDGYLFNFSEIVTSASAPIAIMRRNSVLRVFMGDVGTSPVDVSTPIAAFDGTVRHLAVTWDSSTVSLYVDGVLEASASAPANNTPTLDPNLKAAIGAPSEVVGSGATNDRKFSGRFNEIAIWDTALSAADVQSVANAL